MTKFFLALTLFVSSVCLARSPEQEKDIALAISNPEVAMEVKWKEEEFKGFDSYAAETVTVVKFQDLSKNKFILAKLQYFGSDCFETKQTRTEKKQIQLRLFDCIDGISPKDKGLLWNITLKNDKWVLIR